MTKQRIQVYQHEIRLASIKKRAIEGGFSKKTKEACAPISEIDYKIIFERYDAALVTDLSVGFLPIPISYKAIW